MKTVVLFAPHFPPDNRASVHRARLWAQHLEEFGWKPVIVTTHWRHYEETLDWQLCDLIDPGLEIIQTPALPTKPIRVVGDIGIRGMPWHLSTLRKLFDERRPDFLHITVPSFYSALLGELMYRRRPLPFGIDFIDPWVHPWPEERRPSLKAWTTIQLANVLEPVAVRNAALITGVAEAYYSGVLTRNPHVAECAVTAAMPYGNSERDYAILANGGGQSLLFDPDDGLFHMVFAGAMLPKARKVLARLLEALVEMRSQSPEIFARLRIHFIGTGTSPDNPIGYNILPAALRLGLGETISEHPQRIPYGQVLRHLMQSSAILILGSTEPHYTPSKVYQAVQARRPVFGLLHEVSTAVDVLLRTGAGVALTLTENRLPDVRDLAQRLAAFIANPGYDPDQIDWSAFDAFSARQSARKLALAMDEALERFARRGP